MLDQWKMDLESEDHRARRDMTEKSIARFIKGESERQVTSSSTSSAVFVSDCTCIMGATQGQLSYLCCGLSNGSVCLLNTSNLSKIYLFEADRDPRVAARGTERRGAPAAAAAAAHQLVAVATHVIAPSGSATTTTTAATTAAGTGQLLLCVTLDGVVCVCPMDMSAVLERKKVSRSDMAKVKPYPPTKSTSVLYSFVQFNPKGNRVVAVLGLAQEEGSSGRGSFTSGARHCVAVLSSPDTVATLQSRFTCEREWHTLVPPATSSTIAADAPPVTLCYCGWWSADVLVCVWSNAALQLLQATDMAVVGECRLLRHCAAEAVTNATVSRPNNSDGADGVSSNTVALVVAHNTAATFYVTAKRTAAAETPDLKRPRSETVVLLSVIPTLQTYCTEDIPIREVHLTRSFTWTLVLLLESGALLFLDVETMKLSVHRALNRLRAPDADRYHTAASLALPRRFFCVVNGRPFSAAVVEHNTAILLKAQ